MRYSILIRNTVSDEEFFFFSLSQISEENETNEITVFVSLSQMFLNPLTKFNQIP